MKFEVEIDDSKLSNIAKKLSHGDNFLTEELLSEMYISLLSADLEKIILHLATKKAKAYIIKVKSPIRGGK